jgi:dephospho-CoA kinase
MLKIGLTGGIGSGKTTVAQIFEVLGIPVYYADEAARELMNRNQVLKDKIISTFGYQSYKDGALDRTYLGNLVFADPAKLDLLNAIVHPATILDSEQWMASQTTPYALKEAAIIFETGLEKNFDSVIGVTAPETLRIARVAERDQTTEENIRKRMEQQLSVDEIIRRSDFIIFNDGIRALLPQVMTIHQSLLKKAGRLP